MVVKVLGGQRLDSAPIGEFSALHETGLESWTLIDSSHLESGARTQRKSKEVESRLEVDHDHTFITSGHL